MAASVLCDTKLFGKRQARTGESCETGSPPPSPTVYLLFKAINIRRSREHTSIKKASFLAVFLNLNNDA